MSISIDLKKEGNRRADEIMADWLGHWFDDAFLRDSKPILVTEDEINDLVTRYAKDCAIAKIAEIVNKQNDWEV